MLCVCCLRFLELQDRPKHQAPPPDQERRTPVHGAHRVCKIGPLTRTSQSSVPPEQSVQWESRDPWAERTAAQDGISTNASMAWPRPTANVTML